jgi:hypothetical protein
MEAARKIRRTALIRTERLLRIQFERKMISRYRVQAKTLL